MKRSVLAGCSVVIVMFVLGGRSADGGGVTAFTSESAFFAAADIESTETFGGYSPAQVLGVETCQVDDVIYTSSNSSANWFISSSAYITRMIGAEGINDWESLSFGPGNESDAIGFRIYTTAVYSMLLDVATTDGQIHTEQVPARTGMLYHGFVAPEGEGIISVTIRDFPGDGHLTNFFLDNVSHGAITPEPATLSLLTLGGLAMLRRRRSCGVRRAARPSSRR